MNNTGKNNGFITPENYFDGLTDRLLDRIGQKESPLPKNNGFTMPEAYLDNLSATIMHKVNSDETKVIKLNPFKKYYYAVASIAAVVILYFGITLGADKAPTFADLASTDIKNYFDDTEISLSSYDLAEFLPLNDIEISDIVQNTLSDDLVIDYLDNHDGLDIEELYIEDYE